MRQRRRTHDRARIVGTLDERLLLLRIAKEVLSVMPVVHEELDIDIQALEQVRLCFLREPDDRLMGLCSYSNSSPHHATQFQDRNRTHRILIHRALLHDDVFEAVRTVHHEFLHSVLGSEEGHGPIFMEHDGRFVSKANEIATRIMRRRET